MGLRRVLILHAEGLMREAGEAASVLRGVYGLEPGERVLERDEAERFMEEGRRQVNAYGLVRHLKRYAPREGLVIYLTEADLYVPGYRFCFGLAYEPAAVVSTHRLRDIDGARYISRLRKEVAHEAGHLLGLGHCADERCVMHFSNSIDETDLKEEYPCLACRKALA